MHYRVSGKVVRSENAAKPTGTASRTLLARIAELGEGLSALDFGCGKLRYTIPLAKQVRWVTAVDSREQVERVQAIGGERATVREFASQHLPNVEICLNTDKRWRRRRFDFVLLANVLTAVPYRSARLEILSTVRDVLRVRGGRLLIVCAYANSRFKQWQQDGRTRKYRDGWLRGVAGRLSFFAAIPPATVRKYCHEVGLAVEDVATDYGQVGYVDCRVARD